MLVVEQLNLPPMRLVSRSWHTNGSANADSVFLMLRMVGTLDESRCGFIDARRGDTPRRHSVATDRKNGDARSVSCVSAVTVLFGGRLLSCRAS